MSNGKFWADAIETKRKYRFTLDLAAKSNLKFEQYIITKVARPSFSVSDTAHSYLNHTFKFPGRVTWEDVSFSIVEPLTAGSDSTDMLMAMLYEAGYHLPTLGDNHTISKASSILQTVQINTINAAGSTIESWTLHNAWISQASLGEFDYTADDLMGIDITLKYDYATFKKTSQHNAGATAQNGHNLDGLGG